MNVERIILPHRINRDGTFDSICPVCYQTIAQQKHELDLIEDEKSHTCIPGFLNNFKLASKD
jgi:hypothetical protein